jgi:LytS/YehU family sensor histidine kinase
MKPLCGIISILLFIGGIFPPAFIGGSVIYPCIYGAVVFGVLTGLFHHLESIYRQTKRAADALEKLVAQQPPNTP